MEGVRGEWRRRGESGGCEGRLEDVRREWRM